MPVAQMFQTKRVGQWVLPVSSLREGILRQSLRNYEGAQAHDSGLAMQRAQRTVQVPGRAQEINQHGPGHLCSPKV